MTKQIKLLGAPDNYTTTQVTGKRSPHIADTGADQLEGQQDLTEHIRTEGGVGEN